MKRPRFEAGWQHLDEAIAQWTEETGATWYVRKRITNDKGQRVLLRCARHHVKRPLEKCRAKTAFVYRPDTGLWLADLEHTVFEHNGHPAVERRRKRLAVSSEASLRDNDADELSSEQLRLADGARFPGLSADARLDDPRYSLAGRALARSKRRCLRHVTTFESADLFEQVLREEDRAYFVWWEAQVRDPMAPLMFLRVHGVTALDLQRNLVCEQFEHGALTKGLRDKPSHARHAVFHDPESTDAKPTALLAINVYALRCYRLLTLHRIDGSANMPMAPVLLQAWGVRPLTDLEYSARRFGMLATLRFFQRCMGRKYANVESHMYSVNEPGFEIYDNLPGFIGHFASTDAELRIYLYISFYAGQPSNFDLSALLAAFMFQKHRHLLGWKQVVKLHHIFTSTLRAPLLQKRHRQAWRLIRSMHGKVTGTHSCHVKLTKAEQLEEPLPLPAPYYLYRLAFDPDDAMLSEEVRYEICANMVLCETFPIESVSSRSTQYDEVPLLKNYTYALAKRSHDPLVKLVQPFTKNRAFQAALGPLFSVLRAFDYHRHKGQVDRVPNDELDPSPDEDLIDGPLIVRDPLDFALYYANLPIARYARLEPKEEGLPPLAYFDDSLYVWRDTNAAAAAGTAHGTVAEQEAQLLIRNPAFYVK